MTMTATKCINKCFYQFYPHRTQTPSERERETAKAKQNKTESDFDARACAIIIHFEL